MRRTAAAIILTLALLASVAAATPSFISKTHRIEHETLVGGKGHCSATAIGPHALLTASHCEAPTDILMVDGDTQMRIVAIYRDDYDHSVFLLDGPAFKTYADVAPNAYETGDNVEVYGNPGNLSNVYRRGYVAGRKDIETGPFGLTGFTVILLDLNGFFGDSGAGVFNSDGQLVGVVSQVTVQNQEVYTAKFMAMLEMKFTSEQYAKARTFLGREKE